jgi:hypothetical protein
MKCPLCNTDDSLAFCKDSINAYSIVQSELEPGKFETGDLIESNDLDNSWLECSSCLSTSEDDVELKKIFDSIF